MASSKTWGSHSCAGEQNMTVSSLPYHTVRLAQWLSIDNCVAGRSCDILLATNPCVSWNIIIYLFPSALHFTHLPRDQVSFVKGIFSIDLVIKSSSRFHKLEVVLEFPDFHQSCVSVCLLPWNESHIFSRSHYLLLEISREHCVWPLVCLNQVLQKQCKFKVMEVQHELLCRGDIHSLYPISKKSTGMGSYMNPRIFKWYCDGCVKHYI